MNALFRYYKGHRIMALLAICIPASILAGIFEASPILVFILSLVAFAPLANLIGIATEVLSEKTGPKVGGLINASLGNLPELVVTLVALKAGLTQLVLGSIAGSFAGNLLFVLGLSMFAGGLKHGEQSFHPERANTKTHYITIMGAILMFLPFLELFSPEILAQKQHLDGFSEWLALILLALYAAYVIATFKSSIAHDAAEEGSVEKWTTPETITYLVLAATATFFVSHFLVESIEAVTQVLPISEAFIGFIIIPVVGNAAEHFVAVTVARKNKMALSVEIAVGSAIQIVGLMAPIVIFAAALFGTPIELAFVGPELLAVIGSVMFARKVLSDAKTNWEEGLAGILGFAAIALMYWYLF